MSSEVWYFSGVLVSLLDQLLGLADTGAAYPCPLSWNTGGFCCPTPCLSSTGGVIEDMAEIQASYPIVVARWLQVYQSSVTGAGEDSL